jgi:hypothetical protein
VVRDVGGIHAQVQASAELQLAARVEGATQQDVRAALWRDRTLVKAWTLRGTLHLHPADELGLWLAARPKASELEEWRDPAGVIHPPVAEDEVHRIRAAVWDALGDRSLLREQLVDEVVLRVGRVHEGRLRSGFAFFTDELCQGPPQGSKITFVRPDGWIEDWQRVDEQVARAEISRRFLHAYGPARPADFAEWTRETWFEPPELEEVDVEGHRAFVVAGDTVFPKPPASVRLLSEYDVYVMGFREREQLVPPVVREQVAAHGRGRYEGPAGVRFLLVDGIAAGLWERKKRSKRIEIRVAPAGKLTRVQRAELDAEVERVGAFLGLEPALTVE